MVGFAAALSAANVIAQSAATEDSADVPAAAETNRPNLDDLRERGRVAMREWVSSRGAANKSRRATERKTFDACLELAAVVHSEGGGDLLADVLAEAEEHLKPAQDRASARKEKARMAANVGAAYYHMAGDPKAARAMYRKALALDADDEVAIRGLALLDRDEEIDTQKEIENERLREIQDALDKEPRSQPSRPSPVDGSTPIVQP